MPKRLVKQRALLQENIAKVEIYKYVDQMIEHTTYIHRGILKLKEDKNIWIKKTLRETL